MALFSVADIIAAIFLLIVVVDAIVRHDERGSSKALAAALVASMVMVLLDSTSGLQFPSSTPEIVLLITVAFSAIATKGILMFFYYYCYQYFRERTNINKWLFAVPMALLALTIVAQVILVFTVDQVTLESGSIVVVGDMHPIIKIASIALPLYLPVLAIIKRKEVGSNAVFFAGAPAIFGILISFIGLHDFATFVGAAVVFFTYVLLQNGIFNQQAREQQVLEESNAELEALNSELEQRQAQLEEATSEQEAQIEEITALNEELEASKDSVSEAYGMVEGFSKEYHTIWIVSKGTSRMRLVRSNGKTTIQGAVQMGIDEPEFDPAVALYANAYIEPEDRERFIRDASFAEVLRQLEEHPDETYRVTYLRRTDDGNVGYHQIAFANADTNDGQRRFVYGFRDVDAIVREEHARRKELEERIEEIDALNGELEERQAQLEEAAAEQEAQLEETQALNGELEERQTQLEEAQAEQEAQFEEIQALNKALRESQEGAIRKLLAEFTRRQEGDLVGRLMTGVGEYFDADRSYVFETSGDGRVSTNTYEWCADGVRPEIENLQAVPMETVEPWNIKFREGGCFYLSCDDEYAKEDPMMYEVLEPQGIDALMAAPITAEGEVIGFLGVDNPRENVEHKLLLSVAASMIYHEIRVKRDRAKEERYQEELAEARDAANAANAAKTSFLFNMSHDIRTPMNAIIGFTNLLERYQEDPKRREDYLHKIQSSSGVLLEIINNVLDMARIESGAMALDESPYHVGQLTVAASSVFADTMEAKGIEFTENSSYTHDYVWCDATKVTQIINNIVSNSYKYTEPGGRVDLRLEELPYDRDGWTAFRITVSDTGIGMDAEFIPTIFEEFTRERTTTMSKVEGTGLGMPIVKRLVELMGGSIDVQSEKGVGTTFTVTLPVRIADEDELEQANETGQAATDFTGRRILLAEDNDLNAEIAIEILSEVGFEVDRAEDGRECVRMMEEALAGTYDVVLMDVQMPNMNGHDATRAIRALGDPAKASTPILAMTANAFEEDRRAAFEAGMDGHVAKPIDVPDLMKTLMGVLG